MSMTRKDYELIAKALRDARPAPSGGPACVPAANAWDRCVREVCRALKGTNPRFNAGRFIDACLED